MKATVDIPDELYRRFKAWAALEGRSVRAVVLELVQRWLDQETPAMHGATGERPRESDASARGNERTPEQWLEDWFKLGEEAFQNAPPGPSAREILEADRSRLERS